MANTTVISVRLPADLTAKYQLEALQQKCNISEIVKRNLTSKTLHNQQQHNDLSDTLSKINDRLSVIEKSQSVLITGSNIHSPLDEKYQAKWCRLCDMFDENIIRNVDYDDVKQLFDIAIKEHDYINYNDDDIVTNAERWRCFVTLAKRTSAGASAKTYIELLDKWYNKKWR